MAGAEPDSEVHCLRTTMPSMSRLRKARAFFHDLPGRSGFGVPSGAPASQARVSFVTRENVERSFMVLREGHQLDRSDLQHVQVHASARLLLLGHIAARKIFSTLRVRPKLCLPVNKRKN